MGLPGTSVEPFAPEAFHLSAQATQGRDVPCYPIVRIVTAQLTIQHRLLLSHGLMPIISAPLAIRFTARVKRSFAVFRLTTQRPFLERAQK